jgi:outer membrane protein insertion porin family
MGNRPLSAESAKAGFASQTPSGNQQVATPPPDAIARYEGKNVEEIDLPAVEDRDREHLLELLPQKVGQPLTRDGVRGSIRALYATGRFADIQAEVAPSGDGVRVSFPTSPNFFVGGVDVEGAPPNHPTPNQIVNAAKLQLGEKFTSDRLNRAIENIRQTMQEDGYYRAKVTAETISDLSTSQANVLFHVRPGAQAHIGQVTVTGSSSLSPARVRKIAGLSRGGLLAWACFVVRCRAHDRVTADRVNGALQRLRKRFQKENRALAQVEITQELYHPETNSVDFTFQIDPGPLVVIYATGYRISRSVMRKEIPVYEENAVDEDLLNEGKRNLLDYLQSRGHFDATINIRRESDPQTVRVIYEINPGPVHKLVVVQITGNKNFMDKKALLSRMQIQPAGRFFSHGRYSSALLKSDVATLEELYRENGYRQIKIESKVDENYRDVTNDLAVRLRIDEGPQTLVGGLHIVGNTLVPTADLPERETQLGQPYSEESLASDRQRILDYYFNHGFPNATLEILTKPASEPDREDITYTIQEGERFTVDRVMLAGTENTRNYVVRREVQLQEGQPLSQQGLLDTQTRLYDLGIFSQVDTAVQNPEGDDPRKNVLVQVREAKRYTFTYVAGLEFQTGLPAGVRAPQGATGVSPRVGLDVSRLNLFGRDQSVEFESHVGSLEQRGLISYTIPKLFDSDKLKTIYTIFYDNSLNVATFTSQRLEGKIDLRQQFGNSGKEPGTIPGPSSITYRFDYRRVKASNFASGFNQGEIAQLSLPALVGGPGLTYIYDKRDNPLESTKGNYFTLDAFAATGFFGSRSETTTISPTNPASNSKTSTESVSTNFGRALVQQSSYYAFGRATKPEERYVLARSTTIGLIQPFGRTRVLPPGACPLNPNTLEQTCNDIATIPLPEQFFAGGGNSHRGFGLNQAGPRDPASGFPVGGTALFVNNLELRFPEFTLPYLGEGFGFAIFHDMGDVYTAPHDMLKGLLRWHQDMPGQCLSGGTTNQQCYTYFNNSGYDYTSHAVGIGVRYKTPIGPLRFDFGYNLNPTRYLQGLKFSNSGQPLTYETQRLGHFNVFFSIGQPF